VIYVVLNLALDGGEWLISCSEETTPGLGGPRNRAERDGEERIMHLSGIEPWSSNTWDSQFNELVLNSYKLLKDGSFIKNYTLHYDVAKY
jgi:hypothetical protein